MYDDKLDTLRDLFGADAVSVDADHIVVDGVAYPIIDGVIVLLHHSQWPAGVRGRAEGHSRQAGSVDGFATDIQSTFGAEWRAFPRILPEHAQEFRQYFDVVDREMFTDKRVMDLGCGIGRWSYFLRNNARELILVDFSEAVFVARKNLAYAGNALFFLADLTSLPFRRDCADFVICLGVLHHLPVDALTVARALSRHAPQLLIYLYSALDARPAYQRTLLSAINVLRLAASRIDNPVFRTAFTWAALFTLYFPMIGLGRLLRPFGWSRHVPLFDFYQHKSLERIRQDVYDRFFTRIEQRFSRKEITALHDTFARVTISEQAPQWHFLCERAAP